MTLNIKVKHIQKFNGNYLIQEMNNYCNSNCNSDSYPLTAFIKQIHLNLNSFNNYIHRNTANNKCIHRN